MKFRLRSVTANPWNDWAGRGYGGGIAFFNKGREKKQRSDNKLKSS